MPEKNFNLSYLITVSKTHFQPALFLLNTLKLKTNKEVIVVGNLEKNQIELIEAFGAIYIDEDNIDLSGRLPKVDWKMKYRNFGWYKQMFIRLSCDRFINTNQVVILDSEVFIFDNWDQNKFYEPTGEPRCFYWIPKKRKPDWDYQMYQGAAYLLQFLPECQGIMSYANSDSFKRHISGVVLFSTKNLAYLWQRLTKKTDLEKNIDMLFNHEPKFAFSDHDMYGLGVDFGLYDKVVPTKLHNNLLGWYEGHDDLDFHKFKKNAMWSMCQCYNDYQNPNKYFTYIKKTASILKKPLPKIEYWNKNDRKLINNSYYNKKNVNYFKKYKKQLDYTHRRRFQTMFESLRLLYKIKKSDFIIVETGTLRDNNIGGGHSTYKFAEFCSLFNGILYSVDISKEAIHFSQVACRDYLPWIKYYVSDSVKFLNKFDQKIDLLYLDSLDFYKDTNKQSQKKQLQEIKTIVSHLSEKCLVLLDDAGLIEEGKTKLSSSFLKNQGFKLLIDGYQRLFIRNIKINTKLDTKIYNLRNYQKQFEKGLTTEKSLIFKKKGNIGKQELIDSQANEIKQLQSDLTKITSTKFYKVWQFYCHYRDKVKGYILNLFS